MNQIFNDERFSFIFIGDSLVVMRPQDRILHTKEWAVNVVGIDETDYRFCHRGYFTANRIQFFIDNYTVDTDIYNDNINAVRHAHSAIYQCHPSETMKVPIYNGVKRGREGECWPPCLKYLNDLQRWKIVEVPYDD